MLLTPVYSVLIYNSFCPNATTNNKLTNSFIHNVYGTCPTYVLIQLNPCLESWESLIKSYSVWVGECDQQKWMALMLTDYVNLNDAFPEFVK